MEVESRPMLLQTLPIKTPATLSPLVNESAAACVTTTNNIDACLQQNVCEPKKYLTN